MAWRRRMSIATRNAARVLPEPVGAEMRVGSPVTMLGQPSIWGSVGEPNFARNHSAVMGCAQARAGSTRVDSAAMRDYSAGFVVCSLWDLFREFPLEEQEMAE